MIQEKKYMLYYRTTKCRCLELESNVREIIEIHVTLWRGVEWKGGRRFPLITVIDHSKYDVTSD